MTLKFRAPDDKDEVHVTSTTGHAVRVGKEWREIPAILHKDAIAQGCITSNMEPESIAAALKNTSPQFSAADEIRKGITGMLEEGDPTFFTKDKVPNLKILSSRVGFNVDREQMQSVWAEMQKEAESA